MTYTLELFFEPAIEWRRVQAYFAARDHFGVEGYDVLYDHPVTRATFFFEFKPAKFSFPRKTIVSGEFTLSYFRPNYFGSEADIELSAFMAAFQPRIHDPQMHGMGDGPYSSEGFFNGWNFGNQFSVRNALAEKSSPDIPTMPAAELRQGWSWNYALPAQQKRFGRRRYCPEILFVEHEKKFRTATIWPQGMPVILPKVDFVFIGRYVSGQQGLGLVSWPETLDILQRTGFDTSKVPIEVEYFETPHLIRDWVAEAPAFDPTTLGQCPSYAIIDSEIIDLARSV